MRAGRFAVVVSLAVCALVFVPGAAQACPMCSETIAGETHLPRAYMYSILFMMSMPAIVFSGICVCIYRTVKNRPHMAPQAAVSETRDGLPENSPVPELAGNV